MEKYAIKDILQYMMDCYKIKITEQKLKFRMNVAPDLPTELSGDMATILEVLGLLMEEAFSHTFEGKVVLEISINKERMGQEMPLPIGSMIPITLEIMDTGNHYDIESMRVKESKAKLLYLDSSLRIEHKDNLGAKVSFTVLQKVESLEEVGNDQMALPIDKNVMDTGKEAMELGMTHDKGNTTLIQGLDMSIGLAYVQGNQNIYEELLVEYVKTKDEFTERLALYFGKEDWNNYRIVAHSIKSSSYSVGAMEMGDFAKEMEFAARDLDLDCINKKHLLFSEKFIETVQNIQDYLQARGIVVDSQPQTEKEILLAAIADFDQEKALECLAQFVITEENKELLGKIQESLERLDYFGAEELADNL